MQVHQERKNNRSHKTGRSGNEWSQSEVASDRHLEGSQHPKELCACCRKTPRACLKGMIWNPATIHQPMPTGSQQLIIGDRLVRDLNDILVLGQTAVISFGGASVDQVIKMMELQNDDSVDALTLGLNDVSRNPVIPEAKWESLLICLLNELKEKYRPRIVVLCAITLNRDAGSLVADHMSWKVFQWNVMTRNLTRENPSELRLMDVEDAMRVVDHGALTRDGIHFNTHPGIQWINDTFQTRIEEMEAELRTMVYPVARGSPAGRVESLVPQPLANRLGPLATEANVVQPIPSSDVRERLGTATALRDRSLENRLGTRWSTTGGFSSNHEHRNPSYKDATGSKNLASSFCSGG